MNGWLLVIPVIVISGYLTGEVQAARLKPVYLRTEYCVDPLGIDETRPRLSWQLESNRSSKIFQNLLPLNYHPTTRGVQPHN
jgi:alpha-L-rhamnosidase